MGCCNVKISVKKEPVKLDIKTNIAVTGKQSYSTTVDLSMPDGDQVITPNEGRVFSKVTVKKPDTLVAENIRKDINIGGVVGSLKPYVPVVSSELNVEPKTEIQIFTPGENEYYDKVNVDAVTSSIDSNIVPENIRNNVEILGVKGTMLPQGKDMLQQLVDLTGKLTGLNNNPTVTNYDFLENLDTSKVTSFESMFSGDSLLERVPDSWDTSKAINFSQCFNFSNSRNSVMTRLPNWDYSKGENFESFIRNTDKITEVNVNIPNAKNCSAMFQFCYEIKKANIVTSEKLIYISSMFYSTALEEVDISNTENVLYASNCFSYCRNLVNFPKLNLKNCTTANGFIASSNEIKQLPSDLFGNKVTNFSNFAYNCSALEDCELDMLSCTGSNSMFYNCSNLTNLKLHNIKINTAIGSRTSYGTKLTKESLIFCIKELWSYKDTTTKRTLTMSTPSKTLIADVYVKLITPTQEQIEADPYINNKLPCEVCESTDEGAMTITAYANLKNWTIA